MEKTQAAVVIRDVTKRFGSIIAIDSLHLEIRQGEMFGLVGPDGAGKTTIFRILCGILRPSAGTAEILGLDIRNESRAIKKDIGYLSQRFSLYGDLTVDENIEFFAEINEVYNYTSRREELLDFTRLKPFRKRLAEQLSGGMKQKLALACTLIHKPRIIFLDEPTTGVDPVSRRDFWMILSSLLKERITIVMSTPYLDEAERCSRVALMNQGRIMMVDAPQAIRRTLQGEVVEIVCAEIRRARKVLSHHAHIKDVQAFGDRLHVIVQSRERDMPAIERTLHAEKIEIFDWRPVPASLENVFISLVSKPPADAQ